MGKRRDPRIQAKLQVRIAGIDASGYPLLQVVTTGNISRQGALLEGVQSTFKEGEIVSLGFQNNKARFRVIWVGEPGTVRTGQMGMQSIDPAKCIWDATTLPPTAADTYAAKVKERRHHRRVPCKLGAELYMQGSEALVRVDVRNISEGGCFAAATLYPVLSGSRRITSGTPVCRRILDFPKVTWAVELHSQQP
jgi:hypothetical protein